MKNKEKEWHPATKPLKIEDPGSSFLLYLGPGPPSLLHLTRANAAKPYAGDTLSHVGIFDPAL
jgi:hypothetical protein